MRLSNLLLISIAAKCSLALAEDHPEFQPLSVPDAPFFEQFTNGSEEKWRVSHHMSEDGTEELSYRGKWSFEESIELPGFKNDVGLVLKTPAARHAISRKLDTPFDNTNDTLVLQYEVKLQKGLECGGAYMKLLSVSHADEEFSGESPYQLMFGPDKCGYTNKIHLILKRKNPITGEYEEKHLSSPPAARIVETSTLYTLIIKPNQDFEVRINGDVVKAGNLLTTGVLKPSLNPPKEIADPTDEKPADWVEEEMIPDPNATKPEDWDEDAPIEILDPEASKPADWDEDMPEYIVDTSATKPEDWDDEEDGEWIAPFIPNPECEIHGCGPWEHPKIINPKYKGKWSAPLIENPEYKGEWTPRMIPNPDYYEDSTPSNLEPIGAIGFELWTMQPDILFDNIYLGHSIEEAEFIGNETFVPKLKLEKESLKEKSEVPVQEPETPPSTQIEEAEDIFKAAFRAVRESLDSVSPFYGQFFSNFCDWVVDLSMDPVTVISEQPVVSVVNCVVFIIGFAVFFAIWGFFVSTIASAVRSVFGVEEEVSQAEATTPAEDASEKKKEGEKDAAEDKAVSSGTTTRTKPRNRKA